MANNATEIEARNATTSPLLKLPAELRLNIYKLSGIVKPNFISVGPDTKPSEYPPLMRTSRQLFKETKRTYYENNAFHINAEWLSSDLLRKFRDRAGEYAQYISQVQISREVPTGKVGYNFFKFAVRKTKDGDLTTRVLSNRTGSALWETVPGNIGYFCACEMRRWAREIQSGETTTPVLDVLDKLDEMSEEASERSATPRISLKFCKDCGLVVEKGEIDT